MSDRQAGSDLAIRCEGISKCFLRDDADPYQGLRRKLNAMVPSFGPRPTPDNPVRWALRDVWFEVPAGRVFGVMGGNGSGKSALLKILARVTKPTAGRTEVHGTIGSILHLGAMLVPELTGRETIYQIGTLLRLSRPAINRHFDEIVAFAGLDSQLDSLVRGYSVGMQMRLAFAVFVHLESDVLLIDEGLSVADEEFRGRCLERIRAMAAQGRTVLIVSHELEMMADLCHQVLILDHGQAVICGEARRTIQDYRHRALAHR